MNKGCGVELCGPGFCRPSSLCQDCQISKGSFMWAVEQELEFEVFRKSKPNYFLGENKFGELNMILQEGAKNHIGLTKEDIKATDWVIFEENKFGDFKVCDNGMLNRNHCGTEYRVANPEEFDDLEKAIKLAREMK